MNRTESWCLDRTRAKVRVPLSALCRKRSPRGFAGLRLSSQATQQEPCRVSSPARVRMPDGFVVCDDPMNCPSSDVRQNFWRVTRVFVLAAHKTNPPCKHCSAPYAPTALARQHAHTLKRSTLRDVSRAREMSSIRKGNRNARAESLDSRQHLGARRSPRNGVLCHVDSSALEHARIVFSRFGSRRLVVLE